MDEWVWSNGGMRLTGENWSTGRKTLCSVSGIWKNECGALVVWYWQGKWKYLEKNMFPLDFIYYISHREWPGTKPGSPLCETSEWSWSHDTTSSEACVFDGVNSTRTSDIFNNTPYPADQIPSPKTKTWKGRVARQFRRIQQGSGSPSSPTAPHPEGVTIGVPLEDCPQVWKVELQNKLHVLHTSS